MNILKQLSEEIFDFSKASIASAHAKELKETMNKEFGAIFDLCNFVIDLYITSPDKIKSSLVKMTLRTFGAFMSWIPLGYIFETKTIAKLVQNLLQENAFRVDTIKCLTEIAGLRGQMTLDKAYEEFLLLIFIQVMEKMESIIQGTILNDEYYRIPPERQSGYETFCLQFGLLLTTFVQHQVDLIDGMLGNTQANPEAIKVLSNKTTQALVYVVQLSNIPSDEIFKVCAEFWNFLTGYVYSKAASETPQMYANALLLNSGKSYLSALFKEQFFSLVVANHVGRMPKPKEVLIVQDESGNVVQETYKDTESISLYDTMKRTLTDLATLDGKRMCHQILDILAHIVSA